VKIVDEKIFVFFNDRTCLETEWGVWPWRTAQREGEGDRHGAMVVEDRIRWTSSWDHGIMGSSIITGSNHFTQQDELGNSLTNPL
jgi:hypothetical protein